eukprot:SM000020S06010  [mRNA]  locus=s20:421010:426983:+ [translate_table: standard]
MAATAGLHSAPSRILPPPRGRQHFVAASCLQRVNLMDLKHCGIATVETYCCSYNEKRRLSADRRLIADLTKSGGQLGRASLPSKFRLQRPDILGRASGLQEVPLAFQTARCRIEQTEVQTAINGSISSKQARAEADVMQEAALGILKKAVTLSEPVSPKKAKASIKDNTKSSLQLLQAEELVDNEMARSRTTHSPADDALHEAHHQKLAELVDELQLIRAHALDLEQRYSSYLKGARSRYRESARNLIHYIALRNRDIRMLQSRLGDLGLSSLGRTEAHTLASITAVLRVLHTLLHDYPNDSRPQDSKNGKASVSPSAALIEDTLLKREVQVAQELEAVVMGFQAGDNYLHANTLDLLKGPPVDGRKTYIMVTLPSEAAHNPKLIEGLLGAGMDVARVNCAHDAPEIWRRIVDNIRCCSEKRGQHCPILMDLAGPKLRTGPLKPGPQVKKVKPAIDALGNVIGPARIWLARAGVDPPATVEIDAVLPVEAEDEWLRSLHEGDALAFMDARGKKRTLRITEIVDVDGHLGLCVESEKRFYMLSGTELRLVGAGDNGSSKDILGRTTYVGALPAMERSIILKKGDILVLTREASPGEPAEYSKTGKLVKPAHVSCEIPTVFENVKSGEPIKLDDGKIEGVIKDVNKDEIRMKVTRAADKGSKLKSQKAINLPDSTLDLQGLTKQDIMDLDFIAANADMVAFSFVNDASDVAKLQEELKLRGACNLGIVLKIETKHGFENLPYMLLQGMKTGNPLGVMIARGDLAVELGWERLAEVQEQILWLCEAAHVPVIWATQVLESLAKAGLPSRAEITDAAMGERAECVMLNKGPHIVRAVSILADILVRMSSHQSKKQSMLRSLHVSQCFEEGATPPA